jgi:hypothetical protein
MPDGPPFVFLTRGVPEVACVYAGSIDDKPAEQPRERTQAGSFASSSSCAKSPLWLNVRRGPCVFRVILFEAAEPVGVIGATGVCRFLSTIMPIAAESLLPGR